ncbi:signal peptidase II [Cyanobium sp. Morenito 9A2]|uniref:signal peptidase II n=1 Tax=Cyanobium sp. Morenito 9A2 TaxID=2823718 RepID=UPI0020CD31D1|nr:signal peptidase II [Cyanobium sp. Morenito 9A2]MCP9850514.1 signal peptidase II [Cyanobium sp. Morenito 9A2]
MSSQQRQRGGVLVVAAAVVGLDQLTKALALQHLTPGVALPLLPGLLQRRLVFNTGAAFSLFTNATPLLALVSLLVALGVLIWLLRSGPLRFWQGWGVAMLLGGTIGNGLDRWRHGSVIDFLELVPIDFPIFNGADVAINLAVLFLLVDLIRPHGAPKR